MPCYYTGTAEGDARLVASEASKALTEVTEHLCWLCDYNERLLQSNVLREPTSAIVTALGNAVIADEPTSDCWRAAIDEALK